ncbi:MAG: lytic transglycosylase [Patescibacteria group bacterium]|nr:lytic transglycosylase [Patescibacteria group bacterium]
MKLNLKTTILLSSLLAATLNIWQFFDSALQRRDAFSPSWAYADKAAGPTPAPATPHTASAQAAAPAPDPTAAAAAKLTAAGLKPGYAALYLSVQARTGTPWQLLAAVHSVETGQSGTTSRASYAGAIGPMQFMPATFNHYAADGNGDGVTSITDLDDAMFTAGRYLAAGGADKARYSNALYNYNHSWSYVSKVTGIAHRLGL